MSADIIFSKAQKSKIIQSVGSVGSCLGNLKRYCQIVLFFSQR